MKRFALVAAIVLLGSGCRAPMPNWSMLGPYGATRVPPPPTGGYGVQQPYYAPGQTTTPPATVPTTIAPTSSPVGTGFQPSTSNRWSNIDDPAIGPIAKDDSWAPTRPTQTNAQVVDLGDADVALASHETAAPFVPPTKVVEYDGPIRILAPNSSPNFADSTTTEPPRLRGMAVNDTTRVAEPAPFIPSGRVIDISQLPDSPVAVRSADSRTATATSQSSTAQATVIDGGWKSRTTTLRVAGS
ncbi:MAG: hypothetical protein HYV60_04665 [Planctomycetia bacterium]|nr:hypothetical protein [Planctomycetia bacterium]